MKKICKYFFLLLSSPVAAQNLVPNPGFEDTVACPTGINSGSPDEVANAIGWSSYRQSPDYFNACADSASLVSVPHNGGGYQQPHTGNAYCGFQAFFTPGYREILGCQLTTPLSIGVQYFVNFKVVRAYGGALGCYNSSDKIGLRFSTDQYSISSPAPINNFAHVYTDSIVVDTTYWVTIQGSIIADSTYQYIALGNFFDDANTDTLQSIPGGYRAYYFIDNICVSTDSVYCVIWTDIIKAVKEETSNFFSIFPNPASSTLYIKNNSIESINEIKLVSSAGQKIYSIYNSNNAKLFFSFDISHCVPGIYFAIIKTNKTIHTQKIIIFN